MLSLPPSASPLRELFDVADVVAAGRPGGALALPTLKDAQQSAQTMFARGAEVSAVNFLILSAAGNVLLIQITRRGAFRALWSFGDPTARGQA